MPILVEMVSVYLFSMRKMNKSEKDEKLMEVISIITKSNPTYCNEPFIQTLGNTLYNCALIPTWLDSYQIHGWLQTKIHCYTLDIIKCYLN
jgi:hypothetical protein